MSKLSVLYLDDSATQLLAVQRTLQAEGFDVATAPNFGVASRLIAGRDLVLVDFHMPGLNGADALSRLKKASGAAKTLFYLYTSDNSVAAKFAAYGFDGAITRKGSLDELVRQLSNLTKLVQMRRALGPKGKNGG